MRKKKRKKIITKVRKKIYYKGDDESGYLYLPAHHKIKYTKKQIWLTDLIDYEGPSVYLDFSEKNELMGIEILD